MDKITTDKSTAHDKINLKFATELGKRLPNFGGKKSSILFVRTAFVPSANCY